jgi:hypothetical protein
MMIPRRMGGGDEAYDIRAFLKMSFLRKQESRTYRNCWTPAFAGVTDWQFLEIPIILKEADDDANKGSA